MELLLTRKLVNDWKKANKLIYHRAFELLEIIIKKENLDKHHQYSVTDILFFDQTASITISYSIFDNLTNSEEDKFFTVSYPDYFGIDE